jgi:multiple sugar transport system ATP-binding protein
MIYVTHDQVEAMTLADRVVVMDRGMVRQVDRPMAAYERPSDRFVAGFLGWPSMNFVEGRLLPVEGGLVFSGDSWKVSLPPALSAGFAAHAGRRVTMGIRPEDIRLSEAGSASLAAEVVLIEPLGDAWLVTMRCGAWQVTARWPGLPAGVMPGVGLSVSLNMDRAKWFDEMTGKALTTGRSTG